MRMLRNKEVTHHEDDDEEDHDDNDDDDDDDDSLCEIAHYMPPKVDYFH